jgi:tetraacyldisaccharide 4'-kinase
MHASEVWHSSSVAARLTRAALTPASYLYALGWQTYLKMYDLGFKKPSEPHYPVICVGNLQVGGTGKTPVTLAIAKFLKQAGRELVVSCSGYGSPRSEGATLAPAGELKASEWGDEGAMMRWLIPDLKLVVGRNRVEAARLVHEHCPNATMLMDDGFQHLPLKKHLTIVLDPEQPTNRLCLPAGPYREPRSNRSRADFLIPGALTFEHQNLTLATAKGIPASPSRYSVLCALGRPQRFLEDLNRYCAPADGFAEIKFLGDHDPMSEGTLLRSFPREVPIVVTAKDWVKLRERPDCAERTFLVATQIFKVEPLEIVEQRTPTRL